jgi:hypothetical protein
LQRKSKLDTCSYVLYILYVQKQPMQLFIQQGGPAFSTGMIAALQIVISGGTGQLGRILAAHFSKRGDRVTILTRKPDRSATADPAHFSRVGESFSEDFWGTGFTANSRNGPRLRAIWS